MTKQELFDSIDTVIKINPLVNSTDKTRGNPMRDLLKNVVDYVDEKATGAAFDWNRAITAPIPGAQGVTPGGVTVAAGLENLLFPAQLPQITQFFAQNATREYGASTSVTLNWGVRATSYPITVITVAGQPRDIRTTTGTVTAQATANTDTTFTMTVKTEHQTVTTQAQVNFRYQRMWFQSGSNYLGATDADLSALLQAQSNREFATGKAQARTNVLADEYSYFAYPASFGPADFKVNGLSNTAFQLRQFTYTNSYGYSVLFNLYRSGGKNSGTVAIELL
jgi:hypothetical protein